MKKIIGLVALILLNSSYIYGAEYKDLEGHWAKDYALKALDRKVISGYNSYLRLDDNITRAEVITIINKTLGNKATSDISKYKDLEEGKWYNEEFAKFLESKLIDFKGDYLYPNKPVTREEGFFLIAKILNTSESQVETDFKDKDLIDVKYRSWINELFKLGYVKGYDGYLRPKDNIKRGEFLVLLDIIGAFSEENGKNIPFKLIKSYSKNEGNFVNVSYKNEDNRVLVTVTKQFNSSGYAFTIREIERLKDEILIYTDVKAPNGQIVLPVISYEVVEIEIDEEDLGEGPYVFKLVAGSSNEIETLDR